MKRRSFLITIFVITFLFAAISIAQARGPGKGRCNGPDQGMDRGGRQRNIDACLGELDLSSDQIAQLKKVREKHMENMDRIREDMHKYRIQQRKQLQKGADVDEESIEDLLNQGSKLWQERERGKLRYRQQISALLTQEQKDRLYMCKNFKPKWKDQQGRPMLPGE